MKMILNCHQLKTELKAAQNNNGTRQLQRSGTCEVQRKMHQAEQKWPAHHQFDNIFKSSSKIKEEEVTLELILPNISGKQVFLLNLIVLS